MQGKGVLKPGGHVPSILVGRDDMPLNSHAFCRCETREGGLIHCNIVFKPLPDVASERFLNPFTFQHYT